MRFVESRVRQVVAEQLGIGTEELTPEVSLTEDLAADSLDLLEVSLALEQELGITVPESTIDDVRTYGDLLSVVETIAQGTARDADAVAERPPLVWARVVPPAGRTQGGVEHAGSLTPYQAQAIAEEALRAGRGARLELTVPGPAADASLGRLARDFAWLGRRGVEVSVRRQERHGTAAAPTRPHAAA